VIAAAHPVSIFDAGAIIGTGGTAIEFTGSGNTLTLGAAYTITGAVDPSDNNVLQLGGTGSDTFDLFGIGQQFNGFTTFNVVGGTWTVSGGGLGWNVDNGAMQVAAAPCWPTRPSAAVARWPSSPAAAPPARW
jgi:hypothetical protein